MNKFIKLMENGKDLFEITFNFTSSNTKMMVVKDPSYGRQGYILRTTVSVDNDKYKQSLKLGGSDIIKKQFAIYMGINLGMGFQHINTLSFDDSKRSSKGVKDIIFNFYFSSPALAWALGVDLSEFSPYASVEMSTDTLAKMSECERIVQEAKEYKMELNQQCRQLAQIKNMDHTELWNEDLKFGETWKTYCDTLVGKRIALHRFND